jgi:hypothetical protein
MAELPRRRRDDTRVARHVRFDVERPPRFARVGVPLRMVILLMFFLPGAINWLASLFYLPITTAVLVSQKGPERFFVEDRERLTVLVGWIVGIYSYFAYLTDSLSLDARAATAISFEVTESGSPTPRSALRRIATSLPNVVVFGVFGLLALAVWVVASVAILVTGNYPRALFAYQRGINRWQARLFSYHTSLVDDYPPFRLSLGRDG